MVLSEFRKDEHYSLIDWLLSLARKKYSIDELEVYLIGESSYLIKDDPLSTQTFQNDTVGLALRTIKDNKIGFSVTDQLSEEKAEAALNNALSHSRTLPFKDTLFSENHHLSLDLKDKKLMDIEAEELQEQLNKTALELDAEKTISYSKGRISAEYHFKAIFNLEEMKCEEERTIFHAQIMGVNTSEEMSIENGDEQYSNKYNIDFNELKQNAINWINSTRASRKNNFSEETKVFLTSEGLASLLEPFVVSLYGDYSNKMFMNNLIGNKVGSPEVTLTDDPLCNFSPQKSSFDAEGTERKPIKIIEEGVLRAYIYDKMTALMQGTTTTAHSKRFHLELGGSTKPSFKNYKAYPRMGFSNLTLSKGNESFQERLEEVKEGVLIQHLGNTHSNNISEGRFNGTVFRGSEIKNGEITNGIRGINWSGTVINLFKEIIWLSSERKYYNHKESSTGFYLPYVEINPNKTSLN